MARIARWCILGACTGLAACLTSSDDVSIGPIVFDPVAGDIDGVPPFGASVGATIPMLSADRDGVLPSTANIVFNANGTFTLNLPNGMALTVADSDQTDPPAANPGFDTTLAIYLVNPGTPNATEVQVHVGEDTAGRDLFFMAEVDVIGSTPVPSPVTWTVFGDETDTLPTGTATYNGGFLADVLNATTGAVVGENTGDSVILADFGALTDQVDITLSVTGGDGVGEEYSGTGSFVSGSRYEGTLASSGGISNYSGDFNGAFYGAGAEATAGTFNATDAMAGTELVGGFTGFK